MYYHLVLLPVLLLAVANGQAPSNDHCSNASSFTPGFIEVVTAGGSPTNLPEEGLACGDYNANPDVWYTYTAPPQGKNVRLHTCSEDFFTILDVYSSCDFTSYSEKVDCQDDNFICGNNGRQLHINIGGGETIYVRVLARDPEHAETPFRLHHNLNGNGNSNGNGTPSLQSPPMSSAQAASESANIETANSAGASTANSAGASTANSAGASTANSAGASTANSAASTMGASAQVTIGVTADSLASSQPSDASSASAASNPTIQPSQAVPSSMQSSQAMTTSMMAATSMASQGLVTGTPVSSEPPQDCESACQKGVCEHGQCVCRSGTCGHWCDVDVDDDMLCEDAWVGPFYGFLDEIPFTLLETSISALAQLHIEVALPFVIDRFSTKLALGTNTSLLCAYPTSPFITKAISATLCRDLFIIDIPWQQALACGLRAIPALDLNLDVYASWITLQHLDLAAQTNGTDVVCETLESRRLFANIPTSVNLTTEVVLNSSLVACSPLLQLDTSAMLAASLTTQWPFALLGTTVVGLPAGVNISVATLTQCNVVTGLACVQDLVVEVDLGDACEISGTFDLEFELGCVDLPLLCPVLPSTLVGGVITISANSPLCSSTEIGSELLRLDFLDLDSSHSFLFNGDVQLHANLGIAASQQLQAVSIVDLNLTASFTSQRIVSDSVLLASNSTFSYLVSGSNVQLDFSELGSFLGLTSATSCLLDLLLEITCLNTATNTLETILAPVSCVFVLEEPTSAEPSPSGSAEISPSGSAETSPSGSNPSHSGSASDFSVETSFAASLVDNNNTDGSALLSLSSLVVVLLNN